MKYRLANINLTRLYYHTSEPMFFFVYMCQHILIDFFCYRKSSANPSSVGSNYRHQHQHGRYASWHIRLQRRDMLSVQPISALILAGYVQVLKLATGRKRCTVWDTCWLILLLASTLGIDYLMEIWRENLETCYKIVSDQTIL